MRKVTIGLIVLGVLALAFISMPMRAQNQGYPFPGYPPEFAPSRTSRPRPTPPPLPTTKFNRVERPIPNEYLILLNDDTPTSNVALVASNLAVAHGGNIKSVWTKALKGFSVRMPEAAAIALSQDPRVQYVYENGIGTLFQTTQQGPLPWGLDRIDQPGPVETAFPPAGIVNNGSYTYPNDGTGRDASLESPASEPQAITVGSSNAGESRQFQTNFGSLVDVFAPGSTVPGATIGDPSATTVSGGTSLSAPHVVGVAAMYLYDHPNGTASLPWVVQQVIKSNANICRYEDQVDQIAPCYPSTVGRIAGRPAGTNTPDRLLNMSFLTGLAANPIDNQRFFVWQHYADFKPGGKDEPDEQGLEFWTRNITGNPRLGTGCGLDRAVVNLNNSCTDGWRINTSLAFWIDKFPSMFTTSYGLTSGNNSEFVKDCYSIYLEFDDADQRDPNGFLYWKGVLDSYGDPASPTGVRVLIDQFLNSTGPGIYPGPPGYRTRFGAS